MDGDRLTYHVELLLPHDTIEFRNAVEREIHRRDRRVGVTLGTAADGIRFGILHTAGSATTACDHALGLMQAALSSLGRAELVAQVRVVKISGSPVAPGGPRRVDAAPDLRWRNVTLPDGRVLCAGCEGPLGDWYAFVRDDPARVVAGRSLQHVLSELLQLPWGRQGAWFDDALAALAGHQTSAGLRYACACCDQLTLKEPPPGTHEICAVCGWQDDGVQFDDPDFRGGANRESLREARDAFAARA